MMNLIPWPEFILPDYISYLLSCGMDEELDPLAWMIIHAACGNDEALAHTYPAVACLTALRDWLLRFHALERMAEPLEVRIILILILQTVLRMDA